MITIVVEGLVDEAAARKLCGRSGLSVGNVYGLKGKHHLDSKLGAYNEAARFAPWIVFRDLDHDADCAPSLCDRLLPDRTSLMYLRIAVHATEAWLLADHHGISHYLGVPITIIPSSPDALDAPKRDLVNLARKSKQRSIRNDMVPAPGRSGDVGTGYTARMIDFISEHWNPDRASAHSDSLRRCIEALNALAKRYS